jgi:hypothetical protein
MTSTRYAALLVAVLLVGCASTAQTSVLTPGASVAQSATGTLWWEESEDDLTVLHTVPPAFAADSSRRTLEQAERAFQGLTTNFPECPIPARLGYATWSRDGELLVLFELRRARGCPTTPLVSIDEASGEITIVLTPDQPRMFE